MGGKASKADKPEEVFFENESGDTAAAEAEEDAADGSGGELAEAYSAEASEDEAVVEAAPREPTPPPVVASPLPESENKFAKRFKERSGSFKKGAAGDSAAQSAVNNADGQKLPTKVTPVVELSVDRGEVKRRFSHNDATQYPKIAAAVDSGEMTEEEAATKIQALIRGRSARKELEEQAEAATKIQAVFRGSQTRKNIVQATTEPEPIGEVATTEPDDGEATAEPEDAGATE